MTVVRNLPAIPENSLNSLNATTDVPGNGKTWRSAAASFTRGPGDFIGKWSVSAQ
jgi:hypothetical protein